MSRKYFLDLFAGGGGLSEGFIQAGFRSIAHVEVDEAACFTLKTRAAYHWLKNNKKVEIYNNYLNGKITREELYKSTPQKILSAVINEAIGSNNTAIFEKIDNLTLGKQIDVIIGGPPCQAYSLVGRSRDKQGMKGDERNYLYLYYANFLKRYKPRYFVFENVIGLLSAKDKSGNLYFDAMKKVFCKCGYEIEWKVLSAEKYGTLQKRKRIILVGSRGRKTGFYPQPDACSIQAEVQDIFSGLPHLKAGSGVFLGGEYSKGGNQWLEETKIIDHGTPLTLHVARPHNKNDLNIYKRVVKLWNDEKERLNYNSLPEPLKTHSNRISFVDRYKVVAADLPFTHTVVAHIAKDGHYYIHPDIKQNRSITPREAARIQTFPDNYYFESVSGKPSRTPAFKQIGNAVPVVLANKLAKKLINSWV